MFLDPFSLPHCWFCFIRNVSLSYWKRFSIQFNSPTNWQQYNKSKITRNSTMRGFRAFIGLPTYQQSNTKLQVVQHQVDKYKRVRPLAIDVCMAALWRLSTCTLLPNPPMPVVAFQNARMSWSARLYLFRSCRLHFWRARVYLDLDFFPCLWFPPGWHSLFVTLFGYRPSPGLLRV